MAAPQGSHDIVWSKYAGKQDKYCFGHLNVDGYCKSPSLVSSPL